MFNSYHRVIFLEKFHGLWWDCPLVTLWKMNSSTLNIAMFSSGNSLIWWETKYVRVEVLIYWRVISIDEFGCTWGCLWRCLWILVATFRRLWIFMRDIYKFLRDVEIYGDVGMLWCLLRYLYPNYDYWIHIFFVFHHKLDLDGFGPSVIILIAEIPLRSSASRMAAFCQPGNGEKRRTASWIHQLRTCSDGMDMPFKYTSIHNPAISRISNEWCNSRSCRFLVETKPMVKSLSVESKMAPIVFGEADHGSIPTVLGWETIESNPDVITPWEDMFLMGCLLLFFSDAARILFPTGQVRVVRFYVIWPASASTSSSSSFLRRISTASSRSQYSPPDLNHKESPKIYQTECQK